MRSVFLIALQDKLMREMCPEVVEVAESDGTHRHFSSDSFHYCAFFSGLSVSVWSNGRPQRKEDHKRPLRKRSIGGSLISLRHGSIATATATAPASNGSKDIRRSLKKAVGTPLMDDLEALLVAFIEVSSFTMTYYI